MSLLVMGDSNLSIAHTASLLVTYTELYTQHLGRWNIFRAWSQAILLCSRPSSPWIH